MEKLEVASSEFAKELNEVFYETKVFKFGVVKKDDKEFFKKIASVILRYSKIGLEKELDVIISFLRSGITKYHYSVDFGPHNWMMRGSQIVLIDPFWPVYEK